MQHDEATRLAELLGPETSELREIYWNLAAVCTAARQAIRHTRHTLDALGMMGELLGSHLNRSELAETWPEVEAIRDGTRAGELSHEEALRRIVIAMARKLIARQPAVFDGDFFNARLGEPWPHCLTVIGEPPPKLSEQKPGDRAAGRT